jgi:hypothetical protein
VNDLFVHLLLFLLASVAIVGMGTCYADAEDGPALRNFPRRLLVFLGGCGVLTLVMLLLEHTLASVH